MRARPLLACLLLACAPLRAEEGESLWEIYVQAFDNDAQMQAARATYRAQRETLAQAQAGFLPQASLSLSYTESTSILGGSSPMRGTAQEQRFTLSQPLYRYDLYATLRRADDFVARALAERDSAGQELILRTTKAYFDVLQAQDDWRHTQEEYRAIGRQLEQAEARFEVGLASPVDVKEIRAARDLAQVRNIDAENQLHDRREALAVITGRRHGALRPMMEDIPLMSPDPADKEEWVRMAVARNLDYLVRVFDVKVSQRELQIAKSGHHPRVDGFINAVDTLTTTRTVLGQSAGYIEQFGVRITLPIMQGGAVVSQVRQAAARMESAKAQLRYARRLVEQEARAAYLDVHAGIALVRARMQALESARLELEANEVGLDAGTRDAVDVVLATSKLYDAERNLAAARYNYALLLLQLARVAGNLSDANLKGLSLWLR